MKNLKNTSPEIFLKKALDLEQTPSDTVLDRKVINSLNKTQLRG